MKAALACVAVAALALITVPSASAITDADILNFALNLECLEAEFYSWAAFGKGLTRSQRGGGPPSIGGQKAQLGSYQGIAEEISRQETSHVQFLRTALGAAAVPCPLIDIGKSFSAVYDAVLGKKLSPPFSPYTSQTKFLLGALLFEDVGVVGYNGALDLLTTKAFATAGRQIALIEAYHAGVIRNSLAEAAPEVLAPYKMKTVEFTRAVGPVLSSLLGLPAGALTVGTLKKPTMAPSDMNALAYMADVTEVLNVVYVGNATMPGGFFPNGMTGVLR